MVTEQPSDFRLNIRRAIEAASVLTKLEGGRIPYMKLLKLLYIADRRHMQENLSTITGDRPFSMKDGPVLSEIYDAIKINNPLIPEEKRPKNLTPNQLENYREWGRYLKSFGKCCSLNQEPPILALSPYQLQMLESVSAEFKHMDQYQVRDWLHEEANCAEWDQIESGCKVIPLMQMLHALFPWEDEDRIREYAAIASERMNDEDPDAISLKELENMINQENHLESYG